MIIITIVKEVLKMKYNMMELQEKVKENMTEKRFFHTLGVQYTSSCLAMRYNADIIKAGLAGLLHDYAKCIDNDTMLEKCKKHNIEITEFEEKIPYLLHTKLGAYYAKNRFGVEDVEILNAITYHTTGKPNMTLLEKIVFVADYIEPSRKIIPRLDIIRKEAFQDLNLATYLILENTLSYLREDPKKEIDPMTEDAYNYYKRWYETEYNK